MVSNPIFDKALEQLAAQREAERIRKEREYQLWLTGETWSAPVERAGHGGWTGEAYAWITGLLDPEGTGEPHIEIHQDVDEITTLPWTIFQITPDVDGDSDPTFWVQVDGIWRVPGNAENGPEYEAQTGDLMFLSPPSMLAVSRFGGPAPFRDLVGLGLQLEWCHKSERPLHVGDLT